jgi:hypothetical protein
MAGANGGAGEVAAWLGDERLGKLWWKVMEALACSKDRLWLGMVSSSWRRPWQLAGARRTGGGEGHMRTKIGLHFIGVEGGEGLLGHDTCLGSKDGRPRHPAGQDLAACFQGGGDRCAMWRVAPGEPRRS